MRLPISVSYDLPPYLQRLFAPLIHPVVVNAIRLRNLVDTEDGEPDSLIAVLEFNDSQTDPDDPGHIDLNQLRSSLDENGNFFIWTCSCGSPGCAGLFNGIHVIHSNRKTCHNYLPVGRTSRWWTCCIHARRLGCRRYSIAMADTCRFHHVTIQERHGRYWTHYKTRQ